MCTCGKYIVCAGTKYSGSWHNTSEKIKSATEDSFYCGDKITITMKEIKYDTMNRAVTSTSRQNKNTPETSSVLQLGCKEPLT